MNDLNIFTDGGSRGNPGPAASAFIVTRDGKLIAKGSKFLGIETNNFAEYTAVIIALEWILKNIDVIDGGGKINFILDSELVVKQLNGVYKVKNPDMKILYQLVSKLIETIPCEFTFTSVAREKNKDADRLVNETLDLPR